MKRAAAVSAAVTLALAGCRGDGDSNNEASAPPAGTISPAKALKAAEESGAVPATIGFTEEPPSSELEPAPRLHAHLR
jgi:hypothetical protein